MPEIQLSQGKIHYRDEGTGKPIVLIHGLIVNGSVWDRLLPQLVPNHRCIVPDLPLGSHREAMDRGADLSPSGLAALIDEFIARLGLDHVTLLGNDTGGALCQLVVANHPARIGRLILTNCDAFEHFPPPKLKAPIAGLARVPGALLSLGSLGRFASIRRTAMSMAALTVDPVPDALTESWVRPLRTRDVRRDLVKVLRAISPEATLAAAKQFPEFGSPVLVVWGTRDVYFATSDAERLVEAFADARLELIEGARTFVQLDAPARLAELIDSTRNEKSDRQEVAG
jgi:pimeloyl-ACP methyl ester carboxylesterase